MKKTNDNSGFVVKPAAVGRLVVGVLVAGCVAILAPQYAVAEDADGPADKISSIILAHELEKIRPASLTPEQHVERLRTLGLDAQNLTAEHCAIYVQERLSQEQVQALRRQGIKVSPSGWVPAVPGKHPLGFHLAMVEYASLDAVRAHQSIVRLESVESFAKPLNLAARTMINADDVSNGSGVTSRDGSGVRIAIADSGIDLLHADFPTPAETFDVTDGNCRPDLCDPEDETDVPWTTNVSNTVTDHGTHVSSSALGRGVLGPYQGAAAGANLYFYKIGDDTPKALASDQDMVEAINQALSVGCDIFSMSYGGWHLFMDGSSTVCQAIDNASANGMTSVIAAGNEQSTDAHASVSISPGTTSATFSLLIDNTAGTSPYSGPEDLRVIWRDGVSDGNMVLAATNLAGGESLTSPWSGTSPRTTEAKQYILNINPVSAGASRIYTFTLQNTAGSGSTPLVHTYRFGGVGTFTVPDPFYTLDHPAVADTAIAVGAWTQSSTWTDFEGYFWQYNWLSIDTLAPFSSQGPRIDGLQKPDVVAPGAVTISAKDSQTFGSPDNDGCLPSSGFPVDCVTIDNNGSNDGNGPADYYIHFGTSMACPMAAGVLALALEAAPTMTPAQVKAALVATAAHPGAPSHSDGAGLIDALALIQSVDCNGNGVYDVTEVADGSVSDCDGNGRPDECDVVPGQLSYAFTSYGPTSSPGEIMAMADFDGNGYEDLALCQPSEGGSPIRFLWNNGDGTFSTEDQYIDGLFWSISHLAAGDFDQDGDADLVISMSSSVRILENDGSGAFTLAGNLFGSIGDYRLSVIDLNLDTYPDLVYLRSWAGTDEFGVSLNNGDGTFPFPTVTNLADPPREIVFGDLDNDGDPDMIIPTGHNNEASDVLVLINQGDGSFAASVVYPMPEVAWSVDVGDLDTDGDLDVAIRGTSMLKLLINDGGGSFTTTGSVGNSLGEGLMVVTDANGDLIPDIVLVWPSGSFYLAVYANDGDANFTLELPVISPWTPSGSPSDLVGHDFDADGRVDFAANLTGGSNSSVAILSSTSTPPVGTDCNANGVPDSCEIDDGSAQDCQTDGIPDECQLVANDCNGNGSPDDCDISGGGSSDSNGNGVPDECEGGSTCLPDLTGDGNVGAADLAQLLASWGPYGSCPPYVAADFNQDCDVGAADLAQLLAAWGPCP